MSGESRCHALVRMERYDEAVTDYSTAEKVYLGQPQMEVEFAACRRTGADGLISISKEARSIRGPDRGGARAGGPRHAWTAGELPTGVSAHPVEI